ncbi:helix-turn-helix domain-containing protein [Haloarchaeobius sp. HRN-SO-5]|uniref:helix-turn-helix domain-containing protein n=1 Tax=Haloarchaeobius sp. HRN-SO-5 TaxID=3446118 RepID=UPI003EC05AB6
MTSIAEFSLPPGEFALGAVFESYPDTRVELDRVVPTATTVIPYFWVWNDDVEMRTIAAVFESLPELRSVTLMEDMGERGLFRAEWEPEFVGIMKAIARTSPTVVSASGSADGWTFQLRAEDVDSFSEFKQYCDDYEIPVTLTRLGALTGPSTGPEYDLTDDQREALVLAFLEGYYDDPRETDLEALASQLGISRQAFAGRLRRGYRNIVGSILVHAPRDDGDG